MTNYQKGANEERRIVNSFREKGWIALRSAGSHSQIDVVAINSTTKEIKLIQSKKGYLSPKEASSIGNEGLTLNGTYSVTFELWTKPNRKKKHGSKKT